MQRWMFCTDTHGDMIDPEARAAALRFRDAFKPEIRIDGGDLMDLRPLRKNADDEEKRDAITEDVASAEKWIGDYQPTHVLFGNHDHRLVERIEDEKDADKRAYYNLLHDSLLDKLYLTGAQVFPYDIDDGLFEYGDTVFLHGYHHNMHSAHKLAMEYGNAIMGHVHGFQESPAPNRHRAVGRTCGCMCQLRMKYNRRRSATYRWTQGFMYGWKTDSDKLIVNSVRAIDGHWILPTEFS